MPIAVTCPHCQTRYPKIPDNFAGKTVKCKKEECRQDFLVPVPLSAAELEAAALAALDDAPAQQAQTPAERQIPVTCASCQHMWTVPYSMAGKNVLCPEPECRHRNKVPVPKAEKGDDWRQQNAGRPSLAKENFEKPDDVQDAEAKMVSGEALRGAGLGLPELEPRSLKRTLFYFVFLPLTFLLIVFFGGRYYFKSRSDNKSDQLMANAVKEFNDTAEESRPPAAEFALCSAVLQFSAGEYTLRLNNKDKMKDVLGHYGKARADVTQAAGKDDKKQASAERYVVGCELALATLALGGTDEQVVEDTRLRWTPNPATGRQLRANERRDSVHGELQRTFAVLMPAEFDLKATLLRRLTRELAKKGQSAFAADLPGMLFTEPEQPEAKAIVGLELYRADKNSEVAKQIAEELRTQLQAPGPRTPVPASAQTLWLARGLEKVPTIASPPAAGAGEVLDSTRLAYTGHYLLQGQGEEAVALAQRAGGAAGRLRALALCADWSPDPTAALDAAAGIASAELRRKEAPPLPQYTVLRLAQLAGAAGKTDQAKTLSDALSDDGLKAWAKADGLRMRLAA
ncbi:MAG TPA: hypothetical protein VMZ71_00895, partial [Gemmataceae bacterium]|nr:hypothetical protein [Gemmataceae bacterium]